ncbi:hypothetical protein IHN32_01800 [Deinococcus sp. 14RED07]|uniref:hypothetical protein n=1 Tax=Deinococcus sp. 14RED07 TaxID=2745874 RepID=UPI001E5C22D2|nr:hypothetical protein [Deinococcus sp. 14RED07]MCD0174687.1 hypothetical protein [Deinococcus sp. 14RED07]
MTSTHFKVPLPLRSEIVRDDLLQAISVAEDLTVIALLAPMGFGKTTFLAQLARSSIRPCAWVTLGADDASPDAFLTQILNAYQTVLNEAVTPTGVTIDLQGGLGALVQLLEQLPFNIDLVLDEGDHLSGTSGSVLGRLIQSLPDGFRILLAARQAVNVPLSQWVARGKAIILDAEMLRFSAQEALQALQAKGFCGDAAALTREMDGWPVAIGLCSSTNSPRASVQQLLRELQRDLPAPVREYLPNLAVLDTWNERDVRRIAPELPSDWLEWVRTVGLPVMVLRDGTILPHRSFLEDLMKILQRNPPRYMALHQQAGQVAEQQGKPLHALKCYLQAEDMVAFRRLLWPTVQQLEAEGEYLTVRDLLMSVVPGERTPDLLCALALAEVLTGAVEDAQRHLDQVGEAGFDARAHHAQAILYGRQGKFEAQQNSLDQALQAGPTRHWHWSLRTSQAAAVFGQGGAEKAQQALTALVKETGAAGHLAAQANALYVLQSLYGALGHWKEQLQALKQSAALYDHLLLPLPEVRVKVDLAQAYVYRGQYAQASAQLDEIEPLASQWHLQQWPFIQEQRGDIAWYQNDPVAALAAYERAIELFRPFGFHSIVGRVWLKVASCHSQLGHWSEADHARDMADLTQHTAIEWFVNARHFHSGYRHVQRGEWNAAFREFRSLTASADPLERIRAEAISLELLRRQGEDVQHDLNQLMGLLDQLGSDEPLKLDVAVTGSLFRHAVSLGWHGNRLAELGESSDGEVSQTAYRLRIQALGDVKVWINDHPLKLPMSRGGEILIWLALHGSGSREKIVDALWDGENSAKHHEYFRVAVRRLRGALKEAVPELADPLPYENGSYRFNTELKVELDAFEHPTSLDDLEAWLQYRLDRFQPDNDAQWASDWRAELQGQRTSKLLHAADTLRPTQPAFAAKLYEKLSQADPLHPDYVVLVCQAWREAGQPTQARRAYAHYVSTLRTEIGESPSSAVHAAAMAGVPALSQPQ